MDDYDYMRAAWESRHNARCVKKLGTYLVTSDGSMCVPGYNGVSEEVILCVDRYGKCPRENSKSGEDLYLCPSIHAEMEPILYFASAGIPTDNATLYCSFGVPCKDCMKTIIDSGIKTLVVTRMTFYDELSKQLLKDFQNSGGYFKVLDVVYCPDCYSLNVPEDKSEHDGTVDDGDKRCICNDCGNCFDVPIYKLYVGE